MVTLISLSMLVLLLIGFVSTMSIERRAAGAYEDSQRAKLLAQGAVAHAISLLRTNIPEPARLAESTLTAPGANWLVNPGQLTVISDGASKAIPLHTGAVTEAPDPSAPRDADSVDLNQPIPGSTVPTITGRPTDPSAPRPPMRVRWVNLLRDPSLPADAKNPLIGRYAFWMDDECARVNFNTALGKPASSGSAFGKQLSGGRLTPVFTRGDGQTTASGGARQWSLGRPQSVNLDALLDQPSQLKVNPLLARTFLQGFARYPEAIMDYVDVPSPQTWYDQHRYSLTFYNRSPEFNAFGKSRFFTSYIPLSLEAGPTYQHPFVFDPTGKFSGGSDEVLHLNSLLGVFGFTSSVQDDDGGGTVNGGNVINRAQIDLLLGYMQRSWPGYDRSFYDKYGEAECRQIALNILLMARMSTAQVGSSLTDFSQDWGMRSTSVNYSPDSTELAGSTPERFYWRFQVGGKQKLMLPQMPGPYITEIRLLARAVPATPPPSNHATKPSDVYLQYWYEAEYYMNSTGPVVDLAQFPVRMDYLDILTRGGGIGNVQQQFGPTDGTDDRAAKNWNTAKNLARLATLPADSTVLGPAGGSWGGAPVANRVVVTSKMYYVGLTQTVVPDSTTADWNPAVFDSTKGSASLRIRFRPGMGILAAPGRPRQMIPLGLTQTDTLQATFQVPLNTSQEAQAVSWQISDPRLSSDLTQWTAQIEGPGPASAIGTPGKINDNEPADNSDEKSKFHYIERAPEGATIFGAALNRGDEYTTDGRTASPGYWSLIHTGMQSSKPWRTLDFSTPKQDSPPDWLLLDLFGATYPMAHDQWRLDQTLPDSFSTPSFMNSTAGQVNVNNRIYPENEYFHAPERKDPLRAVLQNLPAVGDIDAVIDQISNYQTQNGPFDYLGKVAEVTGFSNGATQWDKETVLRNMAGCLTTRSNTFGVWGVAQAVRKNGRNTLYDRFERGDAVAAEKRFYALVERYVWPGRDGVPGNGRVNPSGRWDDLARQRAPISITGGPTDTLFQLPGSPPLFRNGTQQTLTLDTTGAYAVFDGPERVGSDPYTQAALGSVVYQPSRLEDADNPPQPVIRYRVVYFRYLDQ